MISSQIFMQLRFNEDFAYVPTKDTTVPLTILQSVHAIFIMHASQLWFFCIMRHKHSKDQNKGKIYNFGLF